MKAPCTGPLSYKIKRQPRGAFKKSVPAIPAGSLVQPDEVSNQAKPPGHGAARKQVVSKCLSTRHAANRHDDKSLEIGDVFLRHPPPHGEQPQARLGHPGEDDHGLQGGLSTVGGMARAAKLILDAAARLL